MPAPKKTQKSDKFGELHARSAEVGEKNDCVVKAIAIVTGRTYAESRTLCAQYGRVAGRGMAPSAYHRLLRELGYELVRTERSEMLRLMASYPGADVNRVLSGRTFVTTHHPARFPAQWPEYANRTWLLHCSGHVAAMTGGRVHDWTEGRSKRVYEMYEVRRAL